MSKTKAESARDAARAFGRQGGLIGGKRRARALTGEERSAIARQGAAATNRKRWGRRRKRKPAAA